MFCTAQLQNGVSEVRTILGPSVIVNERSIEDALWHYYYDVEKTVNYLLRKLQLSSRMHLVDIVRTAGSYHVQ